MIFDAAAVILFAIACTFSSGCEPSMLKDSSPSRNSAIQSGAININSASADELETLPNIGETLAQRIVEFRAKHGRFRKPEHLMLVPGISEKRFREIRSLIRTE